MSQIQLIRNICCALFLLLFVACSKRSSVEFPFNETEHLPPKRSKAVPTVVPVPDSLARVQYKMEEGQLVRRYVGVQKKPGQERVRNTKSFEMGLVLRRVPEVLTATSVGQPKAVAIGQVDTLPVQGVAVMAAPPQKYAYTPPANSEGDVYGFLNYSQDQGLPISSIQCIIQDRQGRIWFGTENGLACLDGEGIKVYTIENGLSNNYAYSVLEDRLGRIWVGTYGGGLNVLVGGQWVHYTAKNGLAGNFVRKVFEDSQGRIWVGTRGGGVSLLQGQQWMVFNDENGLSNNYVWDIAEGKQGQIFIGTSQGLNVIHKGQVVHYTQQNGLPSRHVRCILEDRKGRLWLGTKLGLVMLKDGQATTYTTAQGLSGNSVRSLFEDKQGQLWVGTNGNGLNLLKEERWRHFSTANGLSNNYVKSIIQDAEGGLWIGTTGGGVNLLREGRFTHLTTAQGLSGNFIRSVLEDSKGRLWVGSRDGGLSVLENGKFIHYTRANGMQNNLVYSLLEDRKGQIWIGTSGGLSMLAEGQFTHYTQGMGGLSNKLVRGIMEDRVGRLWIGTNGGGLNVLQDAEFFHFTTENGLSNNFVYNVVEDSKGGVWVGTNGGGVCLLKEGQWLHYTKKSGLSHDYVRCIFEDSQGGIWIGTDGGGLNLLQNGVFSLFTTANGLGGNAVQQVGEDSLGNIWAGTGNGLTRISKRANGKYFLKTWRKEHGFKFMDFNGLNNPMLFDGQGYMWSAVGRALTKFNPPPEDRLEPQTFLTGLALNGREVNWFKQAYLNGTLDSAFALNGRLTTDDNRAVTDTSWLTQAGVSLRGVGGVMPYWLPKQLTLPYGQNHLTFYYGGAKHEEQSDVVYRFLLEGLDEKWNTFTKETKADYRNMPPGHYTFRVRSRGSNLLWSNEASLSFTVLPPWWRTWWAYVLYAIGFAIVAYGVMVWRTRSLRIRQILLEETVEERTKELTAASEELLQNHEEMVSINETLTGTLEMVEKQQEDIVASMSYAQKIQTAILATEEELGALLGEFFLVFAPRDGVSGDFYWAEQVGDLVYVAVADCTGHGIPGAMVSMVCHSTLSQVILAEGYRDTGKILDRVREVVVMRLSKSDSEVKDGMDISLAAIHLGQLTLQWSGANNPLWLINPQRPQAPAGMQPFSGQQGGFKLNADRQPVGAFANPKPFTAHQVALQPGDCLYLFTDGLQDQFGGTKNRKYMVKKFRQVLWSLHGVPMAEQRNAIWAELKEWMGSEPQVDDICVLGIKVGAGG